MNGEPQDFLLSLRIPIVHDPFSKVFFSLNPRELEAHFIPNNVDALHGIKSNLNRRGMRDEAAHPELAKG